MGFGEVEDIPEYIPRAAFYRVLSSRKSKDTRESRFKEEEVVEILTRYVAAHPRGAELRESGGLGLFAGDTVAYSALLNKLLTVLNPQDKEAENAIINATLETASGRRLTRKVQEECRLSAEDALGIEMMLRDVPVSPDDIDTISTPRIHPVKHKNPLKAAASRVIKLMTTPYTPDVKPLQELLDDYVGRFAKSLEIPEIEWDLEARIDAVDEITTFGKSVTDLYYMIMLEDGAPEQPGDIFEEALSIALTEGADYLNSSVYISDSIDAWAALIRQKPDAWALWELEEEHGDRMYAEFVVREITSNLITKKLNSTGEIVDEENPELLAEALGQFMTEMLYFEETHDVNIWNFLSPETQGLLIQGAGVAHEQPNSFYEKHGLVEIDASDMFSSLCETFDYDFREGMTVVKSDMNRFIGLEAYMNPN